MSGFEEWRVTGEPGHGYPPYEHVWSIERGTDHGDAEAEARAFIEKIRERGDWQDGPHLSRRWISAWEPVR